LITAQADTGMLRKTAREEGMHTLRESGIEKVLRGTTTVTELVRVTGRK
jgi:type II secretory ATPase GspE/PulE/Tfp pilus assembly ATPase PilB-like protein